MLYAIVTLAIMAGLLNRAVRQDALELKKLDMRFKLFALRDELRRGIIEESVPHNQWTEYLDTTLTKTIDALQEINVWEALALVASYRNDSLILQPQKNLEAALKQKENAKTKQIYDKYVLLSRTFPSAPTLCIGGLDQACRRGFNTYRCRCGSVRDLPL